MAAIIQATISNSTGPTDGSAEGGIIFGRDDLVGSTTPVPKPNVASTAYSWYKMLSLKCTSGGGTTSLLNRKVNWNGAPSTGLTGDFLTTAPSAYTQATSANAPTDNATTNDATPTGYTLVTTSYQTYDAATVAAVNATKNGKFCQFIVGISNLYTLGAGASVTLPSINLQYDEQ